MFGAPRGATEAVRSGAALATCGNTAVRSTGAEAGATVPSARIGAGARVASVAAPGAGSEPVTTSSIEGLLGQPGCAEPALGGPQSASARRGLLFWAQAVSASAIVAMASPRTGKRRPRCELLSVVLVSHMTPWVPRGDVRGPMSRGVPRDFATRSDGREPRSRSDPKRGAEIRRARHLTDIRNLLGLTKG